jgi:cell division transport system permease protein
MSLATLWMDSILTESRILFRILIETVSGLRRSGWMNVVIVVTLASILCIFGSITLLVLDSQTITSSLGKQIGLSVYLKQDAKTYTLKETIQRFQGVDAVELTTREEAWKTMQETTDVPDIPNPLPDTLHVSLKRPDLIEPIKQRIMALNGIEQVQYPQAVVDKLRKISNYLALFGIITTLVLGALTSFIVSNTIHLRIEAKSREIEILRMMGVGNWFIRLPFLLQGTLYGLFASLLAASPLPFIQQSINDSLAFLEFRENPYAFSFVLLLMLLIGVGVGATGSWMSVRRYLRI